MVISSHIFLENIIFHAYHGILPQESKTGNTYILTLRLKADITSAIETDELAGTVNYVDVYHVLKEEMDIPSKLLEHVGGRIVRRLFHDFPTIEEIELKLAKQNPPMGADIHSCGVELHGKRNGE
ncbi:MAG: Dihydroneopterin aldolase [Candidatus Ordinivivax streblomastigis]|uniref:7,8-dihydroneopterin aldolase n=1 Tax=Candidatus Ordinivivax streblomastigis TaxID=2540710 RepID=A0A5M8NT98_9BACT|nr:MAG: Dihydroneopterin aldolase [Candidatus Ordinivivax streblomastigis]